MKVLETIDILEQQINALRFISESLSHQKKLDNFYMEGCQASIENINEMLEKVINITKKSD